MDEIYLGWSSTSVSLSQQNEFEGAIEIIVLSRKLKGANESPSDILFRSHHYDFELRPSEKFYNCHQKGRSGFFVELKLFRNNSSICSQEYVEFTDKSLPIIRYSFAEYSDKWCLNLFWPDSNYTWKGMFIFELNIYRKCDSQTFKKIMTYTSSEFTIVSKPSVFLKKRKESQINEKENIEKTVKKKIKKENKFYEEEKSQQIVDLFNTPEIKVENKISLSNDSVAIGNVLSLNFSQEENNHPYIAENLITDEQTCSLSCKESM
eukprot:gene4369-7725_t